MTYLWTQLSDKTLVSLVSEHPETRQAMSARVAATALHYKKLRSSKLSDPSSLRKIAMTFDQGVCRIMDLHPTEYYYATELAGSIKEGEGDVETRLNALFEQLQSVVPASQKTQQSDGSASLTGGDEGKQSYCAMLLDMLRQLREAAPSSYCSAM